MKYTAPEMSITFFNREAVIVASAVDNTSSSVEEEITTVFDDVVDSDEI